MTGVRSAGSTPGVDESHEEGRRMAIKIALAGNPNSGKTTMFNDLTGANQSLATGRA